MQKLAIGTSLLGLCILATTLVSDAEWPYKNKDESLDPYYMGGAMYRTENGITADGLYRMGRQTKPLRVRHRKNRFLPEKIVTKKPAQVHGLQRLALEKELKEKQALARKERLAKVRRSL